MTLVTSPNVSDALAAGQPVVALESTVITHGMAWPTNLEVARRLEEIVRQRGAAPATVGVIAGRVRVGLTADEIQQLAESTDTHKISLRDLPIAAAQQWDGGTTVASTAWAAHRAGIAVFATGGIGGVHPGEAMDISADLPALARTPIVVVSAGAKAILDLPRTVEWLETHGVPVIGYGTDEFPAFYSRSSGLTVAARVESAEEVAAIARAGRQLGLPAAVLVGVPVPAGAEIPAERIRNVIAQAEHEARSQGVTGRDLTPFLLARLGELTGGDSTRANIALLENNAGIAADIAIALAERRIDG
ncbi:MAG: pseudouridine-5'-phosphate glycosidase [Anaerolineae bacterium]